MDATRSERGATLASKWAAAAPYLLSVLRIIAAVMFIQSGTVKLFGWPMPMPPEAGRLVLLSQVGIGGIVEVVGGVLALVGLFTRPVAFLLAGQMAVAYFQFHFPSAFWPMQNGGTDAVLYCFLWLYFSASGAGAWSLDALLNKKS